MADTLDVSSQTRIVKEVALARLLSDLSTAASGVFQCVELANHDGQVGMFGGGGRHCLADRQAAPASCEEACQQKAADEESRARKLDHG